MKRIISLFVVVALLACLASSLFSADTDKDKALNLEKEIRKQEVKQLSGIYTFCTGVIIGAVGAVVLGPVYNAMGLSVGTGMAANIYYAAAGGVALASLVCIIMGGTEWLFAAGKLSELKKMENDITFVPYMNPCAQNNVNMGLGVSINL